MPLTDGLEIILRHASVDSNDWFDLIEARRKLLASHLDSFTLPTIGSLRFRFAGFWPIEQDRPKLLGQFDLDLQGLLHWGTQRGIESAHDSESFIWGLARKNFWVLARVVSAWAQMDYPVDPQVSSMIGPDRRFQRALEVEIRQSSLGEIREHAGKQLGSIWETFGEDAKQLFSTRKRLYEEAQAVVQAIELEEQFVTHLRKLRTIRA